MVVEIRTNKIKKLLREYLQASNHGVKLEVQLENGDGA
jgi:hypothetical protein